MGWPSRTTNPRTTYTEGDGAPEGGYRVCLFWPDGPEDMEKPQDRLFGWYDVKHTKLEVKVKTGDNNLPPFKLPAVSGPPGAAEGIPGRN